MECEMYYNVPFLAIQYEQFIAAELSPKTIL